MPGEESYEQFIEEKTAILSSLKDRAKMVVETFNRMPGITCNPVQGAMYAFPQVRIFIELTFWCFRNFQYRVSLFCASTQLYLPEKAIEKAKSLGQDPSVFYAFQLLENSGICIVPGAGFGQVPGTYHFRYLNLSLLCTSKGMQNMSLFFRFASICILFDA